MTERVIGPTGSPRRRWTLLLPLVAVFAFGLLYIAGAQSALNTTLFELDKNASNDTTATKVAVLNAAVAAGTSSPLAIQICQTSTSTLASGSTLLIDAERMTTIDSGATASGGGCPAGFSNKFNYSVTRVVATGTNTGHSKSEDVTLLTFPNKPGSDWDEVYALAGGNPTEKCTSLLAVECVFTSDGRAMSIFTQSKDYDEISGVSASWKWRDQSVPDADELDDGFAIKYVDGAGDQNLYFGADRFATNGTKDAGFWFFHDTVAPVPPVGTGDGTFTGVHTAPVDGDDDGFCNPAKGGTGGPSSTPNCAKYDDNDTGGDVLALTTFTGGGAVTTIRIFEWIGPAGSTAALLERATAADCVPGPVGSVCATVNDTTIESKWAYSGKGEPADKEIASGGFLEGGINLSDLGLEGCFSSFMATSRSSASLTADPKDFILGSFEACGATITTDASADSFEIGGSITDTATLTVTGGGPAPTGFVNFYVCGPTSGITSCNNSGTAAGHINLSTATVANGNEYTVTSSSVTPTSAGDYCFYAEYPAGQDPNYASGAFLTDFTDECFTVTPKLPTISTQVNDAGPVTPGTELYDTATLGNTAPPSNGEFGTITFTAYGPHEDTDTCTTQAFQNVIDVVDGQTDYDSNDDSDTFSPLGPGFYNWIAVYNPDAGDVNNQTVTTACGDANEGSIVEQFQPDLSTDQTWTVQDTATVNVTGGGNLDGTVHFSLHKTDDCSDTAIDTQNVPLQGVSGTSVSTTVNANTTFISSEPTLYWSVSYTSDNNGAHKDIAATCTENSSVTITN